MPIAENQFFEVRVQSVPLEMPLLYDLFLSLNGKPVHFRKIGDVLNAARAEQLISHGAHHFLVPRDQRHLFFQSLSSLIKDPDAPTAQKAKFIKESAYLHVEDLFNKKDIAPIVTEARGLVEEMVSLVSSDIAAVTSLMTLSKHHYYTYNHSVDVSVYSIVLAKKFFGDDKQMLIDAGLGGLLHDLGKKQIHLDIINKKGEPLTPGEWDAIRKHPEFGRAMLEKDHTVPEAVIRVVHEHHENFNGSGYPRGLKDEEISELSRVVAIADVFDALTTDRSYQKAIHPSDAIEVMAGLQPEKFDPRLFKSFNKNFARSKDPRNAAFDPCDPHSKLKK